MKKIFIISLFIGFIAIFLSSSFEAKATCPQGYTLDSVQSRYTYNQNYFCDVTIWFCCKWDNDLKQVLIEIDDVVNTNTNNCMATIPDWDDFINWLPSAINDKAYKLCAPTYPPCL